MKRPGTGKPVSGNGYQRANLDDLADPVIVPLQFWAFQVSFQSTRNPEKMLWISVLERAFLDYENTFHFTDSKGRRLERKILEQWFESTSRVIGSFEFICEEVNLDAPRLRGRLTRYKQDKLQHKPTIGLLHASSNNTGRTE